MEGKICCQAWNSPSFILADPRHSPAEEKGTDKKKQQRQLGSMQDARQAGAITQAHDVLYVE